jgi:hypothetical protein
MQVEGSTMVSGTSDTTGSIWNLETYERENVLSGHIALLIALPLMMICATGSRIQPVVYGNARQVSASEY